MPPLISICVPNLNTRPYLPERFESIFNQTCADWELIVCDGFSDDGSWEYIQDLAAREPRMRISQTPRNGIYAGFNDCIKLATGKYIYIATSDDSMMPACLEKMVATLEANPDCGICQCELVIIDEKSVPFPAERQWRNHTLGAYNQNLTTRGHKRLAPYDGFCAPTLFTLYTSITQVLIRKNVFDRLGLFDGQWGSIGDFEWDMRVGLVENIIYIPEKLATWRLHAAQATQHVHQLIHRTRMIEMTRHALARAIAAGAEHLKKVEVEDLLYTLKRDALQLRFEAKTGKLRKILHLIKTAPQHPRITADFVWDRVKRRKWAFWSNENRYHRLDQLLKKYHVPPPQMT